MASADGFYSTLISKRVTIPCPWLRVILQTCEAQNPQVFWYFTRNTSSSKREVEIEIYRLTNITWLCYPHLLANHKTSQQVLNTLLVHATTDILQLHIPLQLYVCSSSRHFFYLDKYYMFAITLTYLEEIIHEVWQVVVP